MLNGRSTTPVFSVSSPISSSSVPIPSCSLRRRSESTCSGAIRPSTRISPPSITSNSCARRYSSSNILSSVRRSKVRHRDLKCRAFLVSYPYALTFDLAPNSINAPSSLLNRGRVPTQVMVDDMPTFAVKVDAFLSDRRGHKDFRAIWRIEPEEIAIAVARITSHKLDDVAVLGPVVVAGQQRVIFLARTRVSK